MTPEAQRIYDLARTDIIEAMIELTGDGKRRLGATRADMTMFCIYGLCSIIQSSPDVTSAMIIIVELLSDSIGATMSAEITERQEDA